MDTYVQKKLDILYARLDLQASVINIKIILQLVVW